MATLYDRIADQYLGAIRSGTLRAGDRFPSVRQLMRTHEVSLSTALQACRRLEDEGWLEARARSGYFVRQPRRAALPPSQEPRANAIDPAAYVGIQSHISSILARSQQHPAQLNLALAVAPPALYPADALARILQRRLRQQPQVLTTMARRHGHPLLRSALARRALERGLATAPEDIIVTQGSTEALNLALRAVTQPGDTVAVESPTFYGLLQIIEALGLRAIEIPTSPQQGLSIEALAFAIEHSASGIQALIAMPTLHNPLGCTMPDERKRSLVELCTRHGVPIIEDDIYSDTGDADQAARPLKAWDTSGIVMHCNSLNKVLAPGLRLGWMQPGRWRSRVEMLKYTQSRFPEELGQATVGEFIASPAYDRHLRRLRGALREARERMAEAVAMHFPPGTRLSVPPGGLLLWVQLPDGVSGDAVFDAALERGIRTSPGSMFSNGRRFDGFLRLSCGAAIGTDVTPALRELGAIAAG